jgi:phenylpropionate dioxygenase-like ring-hydroxylating dioxygenase large terminal subunit
MVGGTDTNSHESIKNDELGLFEIRSAVWQDIVFVNISNNAPEFSEYASKVIKRWSEFDKPLFHGGENSSFSLSLDTNWKLAVENYCESYHLPWVHPELNITFVGKTSSLSIYPITHQNFQSTPLKSLRDGQSLTNLSFMAARTLPSH